MKMLWALLSSLSCALVLAQEPPATPAPGPASNTTAKIIDVDGDVILVRLGLPADTKAKVGDLLENADQLKALSKTATAQLECANGATQTLVEGFDAILNAADATTKCAIDLNEGTAVATSKPDWSDEGRASIRGGPVAAESQHTQFGVTVPAGDAADSEAFVIEGEAAVSRSGQSWTLNDGQVWSAKTAAITKVSDARFESLATNFARIDVRRSRGTLDAQAEMQLQARYVKAFKSPKSNLARQALAETYVALAIPESSVTKYNAAKHFHAMADPESGGLHDGAKVHAQPYKSGTFRNPRVGNNRLDACYHWGSECGQVAANEFCKSKGYASAKAFAYAHDIGAQSPTLVMGDNKVCNAASCDGFASIACQ